MKEGRVTGMENIAKLAEGEKDADNMVSRFGLVATTSPMGRGSGARATPRC